jgi:sortase A
VVSLLFLVLAGLAASCGEESSRVAEEGPTENTSSAPPEQTENTEETTRPEETTSAEETTAAVVEESAEQEADVSQYADASQYADDSRSADDTQYADASQSADDSQSAAPEAPADPTMYLSVPKLGIAGATVLDGDVGLEVGAMHLPGTGYPWLAGSNTYIAGHRVGFPGTGSDRIFFDLPTMAQGDAVILEDSNGETYTYAVSEIFAVTPFDTWVTAPTGSDTVTLQVCTESPEDWFTIGPQLMESGPESGRLIVRAERVA